MKQTKINKRIKSFDGIVKKVPAQQVQEALISHFSYKDMYFSGLKVIGVSCVALILSFGLSRVGGTVSYYSSVAKSEDNKLVAGTLSINISRVEDVALQKVSAEASEEALVEKVVEDEVSTGSLQFDVEVANQGSLPVAYTVHGMLDEANPAGCEEITILANLGIYAYDGLVKNLLSPKMTDLGEWNFMVSLPVSSSILAPGAVCSGSVVFSAGIAGVQESLSSTYTDIKIYTFKLKNWESVVPTSFSALEVSTPTVEEIVVPEESSQTENTPEPELVEEPLMNIAPEVVTEEPVIESPVIELVDPILESPVVE